MSNIDIRHWINNRDYEALQHYFILEIILAFSSGWFLCHELILRGIIK